MDTDKLSLQPPSPTFRFGIDEFAERSLETSYRNDSHAKFRGQFLAGIVILIAILAMFLVNDLLDTNATDAIVSLMSVRFAALCAASALLGLVYTSGASWILDLTTMLLMVVVCAMTVYINSTRPPDYLGHYAVDIVMILGIYILLPTPFRYQVIAAAFFTVLQFYLFFTWKEVTHNLAYMAIPVALVEANLIGAIFSIRTGRYLRLNFDLIRREQDERAQLREALDKVKALSGMLPICASCKKIRDDQGYWSEVEKYVSDRAEVSFSHGLCPVCLDKALAEVRES